MSVGAVSAAQPVGPTRHAAARRRLFAWLVAVLSRFRPCSTAAQSASILVGSMVLAHLLFTLCWMFLSPQLRTPPDERSIAAEVGTVSRVVAKLASDQWPGVLAAATGPTLQVSMEATPPTLARLARDRIPALEQTIRGQIADPDSALALGRPTADSGELVVAVRQGAGWLVFREAAHPHFHGPFGAYSFPMSVVLLIGVPLVALSFWASRRVTSPLTHLAQATETLSLEGERLPIPRNATVEIRRLAGSFNALVERLQKFAADRTGMLAAISHDLRTPLTRLRLRADSLGDEIMREKMLRDVRAMEVMIASSLSYVEQQRAAGPVEALDLAALLQTLADEFADSGFDVTYAGPLRCRAVARPHALERALNNLIENAIKFGEAAVVTLDATGLTNVIDVCDNGPGVADAEKGSVLKPFYRSDAARNSEQGGIGLGLAIANTIVQSHGGTLELLDRAPTGLCVRIGLPKR